MANNFSNDGVFIEKYIARARHIEVQVFGDGQGNAITLGERDCSAQRRHQKVLEETPAPNLPDAVRADLHATAKNLMEAVHYRNAGTVEFILDQDSNAFYFLEVNTRLQVEHGVTEAGVTAWDLVEWMLQLAAGNLPALDTLGTHLTANGHAIQARIYAEDPNKDFQPSAGLLTAVAVPRCRRAIAPHRSLGGSRAHGVAPVRSHAGQSDRSRNQPRCRTGRVEQHSRGNRHRRH